MCSIVEAYAKEKADEAYKQGFRQGLTRGLTQGLEQADGMLANLYIRGYISYEIALKEIGDKELFDKIVALQTGTVAETY